VAEALHPPVTGDVWRIEPEHLVAAARHLPGWVPVPHSLAFFGQPLFAGRRLTGFVLNSVESGHGRAAGRAAWRVGADAATADTGPPGVCLAEVPATAGSNVNLRRVRAPAQLGYPGVPGRSGGECLRLVDLTVRHDPEVDRLVLRVPSSPHEVVPVHLGDMAEFLLPPAHRLLVQVFGDSPTSYLREALGGVLPGASARSPRRTPRVVVDDVVVQRAGVLLRAADLPQRLTDDDDVDHLLRAHAWRRAHGVPTRCFVRQLPPTPAADREFLGRKERKPVFLDLDSLLGLDLLHRAAGDPDALLMFQEALPDPVELPATVGGEPRVVELVVELR
jgi:hypothetical protein